MILVDSSVWIDHLRSGDVGLDRLLDRGQVVGHPFIVGELALGGLSRRAEIVALLRRLPQAIVASEDEVLALIEGCGLSGSGIGYVDAHLLAAARLTPDARLWTRDRRLHGVALDLGVATAST